MRQLGLKVDFEAGSPGLAELIEALVRALAR
jgi:hypothetical protein